MTIDMLLVLAILLIAIVLFVTEWLRVDMVALGVVVTLMLTGVLTTSEALAGFSNSAVVTIAVLFVIGGGVTQTGLADLMGRRILTLSKGHTAALPVIVMLAAALMSSFMSDTGTVAVLLPVAIMLARNAQVSASKLLIPLAFGSLFGGATTLIGTPPNIIVSDLLQSNGLEPFGFFDYTPLGVVLLVIGASFVAFFGRTLLPDHGKKQRSPQETHEQLLTDYHLQDDMARLRHDFDIDLLNILRSPEQRPQLTLVGRPLNGRTKQKAVAVVPQPDTVFGLDDMLIVIGKEQDISSAALRHELAIQPLKPKDHKALLGRELGVAEVVIPRKSRLLGKTLTEFRFHERHALNVLSVFRPNHGIFDNVGELRIAFGDILIVHGSWDNLLKLKKHRNSFIVLGQPEAMASPPTRSKAGIAAAILALMIVAMIGEWLPLAQTALLAGGLFVMTGCLSMDEAYRSINWQSITLVAGMIPMSTALAKVGLVDATASGLVAVLGGFGPTVVLGGLFLLTALFTQFLSNTATAVVVAPIAFSAATGLGVQPEAFLMAVAVAGSLGLASPVASPVNTLVMGAGNYSFSDYARIGLPILALAFVATTLLLPLLFPF